MKRETPMWHLAKVLMFLSFEKSESDSSGIKLATVRECS